MINIQDNFKCCGCSACAQRCPKQCIKLYEDDEGFLYPKADESECIKCGLCEKVCPMINKLIPRCHQRVYAAINQEDEKRINSSSGGIFSAMAEKVIGKGGVVFGARFNENWEVEHVYTETLEGILAFQGSKYVQSRIGDAFVQAEMFLKNGRMVLFSGTSCQIAGLNKFLRTSYDNLITVDVVCHGVPSPLIWRDYLKSISIDFYGEIGHIGFRDKKQGWYNYGLSIKSVQSTDRSCVELYYKEKFKDLYLKGFLSDTFIRPSCFNCIFKEGKSGSDITLADYWGIETFHPEMYDGKGTSCIILNTEKGERFLDKINLLLVESKINSFVQQNSSYHIVNKIPRNRSAFWNDYSKNGVIHALRYYARPSLYERVRSRLIIIIVKLKILKLLQILMK